MRKFIHVVRGIEISSSSQICVSGKLSKAARVGGYRYDHAQRPRWDGGSRRDTPTFKSVSQLPMRDVSICARERETSSWRCRERALYSPGVARPYAWPYCLRYPGCSNFVRWVSRRRGIAQGYGAPCCIDGTYSDSRASAPFGCLHLGCR
ncbi:hypothetical protein BHM03_00029416, partial [Ensete ventricosum]